MKTLPLTCITLFVWLCVQSSFSWSQLVQKPASYINQNQALTTELHHVEQTEAPAASQTEYLSKKADLFAGPDTSIEPVQIAIIIDDLGYNLTHGIATARLPGALTLAVLPQSPNGIAIAELGHQQGKLIMVHTPMSNLQKLPLDTGGLTEHMSQQEFSDTLYRNLDSIPHTQGLNNHMGSYLTQLEQPMQWLMETLARENLFFVDSRTSPESIAWETAQNYQVPSRKRDVFLDNQRTHQAIGEQFDQLLRIAKRRGNAIAIGHPYPETIEFLADVIPSLPQLGVELVPVNRLIPAADEPGITRQPHKQLSAE